MSDWNIRKLTKNVNNKLNIDKSSKNYMLIMYKSGSDTCRKSELIILNSSENN